MLVVTHYCTSTIEQLRTPTFLTSPSARVALCGREMVGGTEHRYGRIALQYVVPYLEAWKVGGPTASAGGNLPILGCLAFDYSRQAL
jgi:hypothetical protein